MRLHDIYENRLAETSTAYNTARAIARELHGDLSDLLAIRQSSGGIEKTPTQFISRLQTAIKDNILELERLGFEFDWKGQDYLRPLTVDNQPQTKIQEMRCVECGGPAFSDLILAEKKDACYYKVKASAKVWPSAYASGRLVQCRKRGAANYGNKSRNEDVTDTDKSRQPVRPNTPPQPIKKRPATPFGPGTQVNEFAPSSDDGSDDGFSEETLKRLAAQWYNGDEDPRVERTLAAAGWEIGWDEGYDDEPGVFVVQAGDVNGNSYISWPAHELKQGVAEGLADQFAAMARARGMNVRRAGTPDEERARTQQKLAQRAAEREAADKEAAEQDFAKLPELKAEYQELQAKYDALGGNRWQYADREQNLTDSERKARSIEPKLNQLAGRIARAEKSQGVAEGVPQPGKSSGRPISWISPERAITKYLTLDEILNSLQGIPYYNEVVKDRDAKDFTWGVTKKVIEYARELIVRPDAYKNWPPIIVVDGKLQDGAHRISTINLMQKRVQPNNPIWKNAKLKVEFGKSDNIRQDVAEDVNTGPQIIYATGPRTMGVNDVDLVFKNLRTGKIVAHVVGNNYHPGDDRLQEFAPPEGGGDGDGDGNQPKTAKYEIRMNNSKQPTYLALGDPQQDSKHEVYKLVSGKTDGPTYYGMGMTLVSNLDWWNFLEKMLGDIMWEDDAIEAGLVDRKDNGDLVFLNKQQGVAEMDKSAPQPGRDGRVVHRTYGSRDKKGSDYFKGKEAPAKPVTAKQASKDALDILKKQGVAEGWEELRRQSKELATEWQKFNSTLEQKMKGMFIPLPTYKGRWGAPSMVANTGDRIVALAKINGVHVPFYISTGQGGKVNVPTGKWYPFFGISDYTWMNKGSEEDILKYYGSSKLKGVAEWLNNNVGNLMALREEKDFFPVFDRQKTTQAINQDLSPPPSRPSTKNGQEIFNQLNKQFEENINNILIRIGSEPYYKNTEKKSDTTNAPMRVPTAVPSIPVTGKEITGPLTLSFNGKQFTVFNISGNLGRANVKQLGDDYKFWSDNQFELKRDSKDGTWVLVPNMAATNKTMINGNAATSPTKLKQGMVIAVGNPEKKIQKLPITVGGKVVAEGGIKGLHIDLQDQQWDAIVGYVINGLKKNMDIGRIELNLYKYAGQEMFDVDQELENRGFRDIADLADHIRQHNGRYVPPRDFNLGKGVAEGYSDVSGLFAASSLNRSFIITADFAQGGTKKFRVRAQSQRVAIEKFQQRHANARIIDVKEESVSEQKIAEKCWDTHRQSGMKRKGNKMVPNCVPK